MKKTLVFLLVLCMVIGVVACAPATPAETATGPEKTQQATSVAEPTPSANGKWDGKFDGVLKFGGVGGLTSASAEAIVAIQNGVELATKELNETGGLVLDGKNYEVVWIWEDSELIPDNCVSCCERLLSVNKVDALLNDLSSSNSILASMALCADYSDVLFFTIEGVSYNIDKLYKTNPPAYANFFKGMYSADGNGKCLAECIDYMYKKGLLGNGGKTYSLVTEDSDFGRSIGEQTGLSLDKLGWTKVASETVTPTCTDFYAVLNKLVTQDITANMSCFSAVATGVAWTKQRAEVGAKWSEFASSYATKAGLLDAGEACKGLIWCTAFNAKDPKVQVLFKKLVEEFGETAIPAITWDHVMGYDVMNTVFQAIQEAGTLKCTEGLTKAMENVHHEGLQGTFFYNDTHSMTAGDDAVPILFAQIQDDYTSPIVYPEKYQQTEPAAQH